jgi:hypothetical protein
MTVKVIIFPIENSFNVLVAGPWTDFPMRVRSFDNRTTMLAFLENLRLIDPNDVQKLVDFEFLSFCPMFSAEINEEMLEAHEFRKP